MDAGDLNARPDTFMADTSPTRHLSSPKVSPFYPGEGASIVCLPVHSCVWTLEGWLTYWLLFIEGEPYTLGRDDLPMQPGLTKDVTEHPYEGGNETMLTTGKDTNILEGGGGGRELKYVAVPFLNIRLARKGKAGEPFVCRGYGEEGSSLTDALLHATVISH